MRPSSMQSTRSATAMARDRSCSTRTIVVPAVDQRLQRGIDAVDDQRRQAERDLVEQQQSGLVISARPIAVACCSPPERLPALAWRRGLRFGKSSSTRSTLQSPAPAGGPAEQQVLLDGHLRRTAAGLPAPARCPCRRAGATGTRGDVGVAEQDAARRPADARRRSPAAASSCRRRWRRPAPASRRARR